MIKRSHIRQFLAVVDAGSFTQAAGRLRVTQPTLSSGIADLERLVGERLFVRDRKRVRMTPGGARLLPIARDLERGFRAADTLNQASAAPAPTFRLGVLPSIAGPMVEAMLRALPPEIEVEMVEGTDSELRAALASGRADVAATVLGAGDVGAHVGALVSEPYRLFVADTHDLAGRASVAPEDLAGEVMIARRSCELLAETSRFFTRRGVRPRFSLRSESEARCMAMVAANRGITTAPLSLQRSGTVAVVLEGYDYDRTIGLVANPAWLDDPLQHAAFAALRALAV